jgi:hypothetical protein
MAEDRTEDTTRIDRAEVERAAREEAALLAKEEEAARAAFDAAGRTAEHPALTSFGLGRLRRRRPPKG